MAVPKRKMSRSNTRHRRSAWKTTAPTLVTCAGASVEGFGWAALARGFRFTAGFDGFAAAPASGELVLQLHEEPLGLALAPGLHADQGELPLEPLAVHDELDPAGVDRLAGGLRLGLLPPSGSRRCRGPRSRPSRRRTGPRGSSPRRSRSWIFRYPDTVARISVKACRDSRSRSAISAMARSAFAGSFSRIRRARPAFTVIVVMLCPRTSCRSRATLALSSDTAIVASSCWVRCSSLFTVTSRPISAMGTAMATSPNQVPIRFSRPVTAVATSSPASTTPLTVGHRIDAQARQLARPGDAQQENDQQHEPAPVNG